MGEDEESGSKAGWTYTIVKVLFQISSTVFYHTIEVTNKDKLPKEGEPTLLCFNHGNGLGDPIVLMSSLDRTIRFCAKDTLWNLPVINYLIRGSGAVPVYRTREHDKMAAEYNKTMYRKVHRALTDGQCVGFAPEGVSRFLPNLATPLKTGVARIALDAVQNNKDNEKFTVNIVPVGISLTHREKFRSDVHLDIGDPIRVTAEYAQKHGERAAKDLTKELFDGLYTRTFHISSEDWKTTRLALTATRLYLPLGTHLSLPEYLTVYRGWSVLLEEPTLSIPPSEMPPSNLPPETLEQIKQLRLKLTKYQDLLDEKKVKDERIRRIELEGAPKYTKLFFKLAIMLTFAILYHILALPGIIAWTPMRVVIKRRERALLSIGPRWNDSVAENKIMFGFLSFVVVFCLTHIYSPIVFAWLWFTLRSYEEAVALSRSSFALFKFVFLTETTLEKLCNLRHDTRQLVQDLSPLLDEKVVKIAMKYTPRLNDFPSSVRKRHNLFLSMLLNPFKREKNDWNEILRLNDHNTMDYVDY